MGSSKEALLGGMQTAVLAGAIFLVAIIVILVIVFAVIRKNQKD